MTSKYNKEANYLDQEIIDLATALKELPSIGLRTALRLSIYLLHREENKRKGLILLSSLKNALDRISVCEDCRLITVESKCRICRDEKRKNTVCVVENLHSLMAIEETAEYQGKYFILYGLLSPADNITEKELGFDKLFMMLQKMDSIEELILAVSLSYEGIATSYSIKEQIANPLGIKVSRLRCGLPFGQSNIEYVDSKTIAYALKDRKDLIDY